MTTRTDQSEASMHADTCGGVQIFDAGVAAANTLNKQQNTRDNT